MDIKIISDELTQRMEASIERIHHEAEEAHSSYPVYYKKFKDELYHTIFDLIEENHLEFKNHEQSKDFVDQLRPACENLLTKYFIN